MKSSVITLLCRPDFTVGIAVTELGTVNAMGVNGPQDARGQAAVFNHQRQMGMATKPGSRAKAAIRAF